MAKYEYIEITDYIQRKNHTTGKYLKFKTATEADDMFYIFRDDIRRLTRDAMPGYERKVFAKINTTTGQAENVKSEYGDVKVIRFFYLKKTGKYSLLRDERRHSVEGPTEIKPASEPWQPMTYRNNYGPWITPPIVPAKPERPVYYLFGEEYSYEEWTKHPFVLQYKLRQIESIDATDDKEQK